MPVVFRQQGFKFFFYSNEGTPREPIHIHARRDGIDAKFWLFPVINIAYNGGYSSRTQRELVTIVEANRDLIIRTWNEHFRD